MTTVAWDGKLLVADSQSTVNGLATLSVSTKIFLPPEGVLTKWTIQGESVAAIGLAGCAMAQYTFTDMLAEGLTHRSPVPKESSSFAALVITHTGKCFRFNYRKKDGEGPSVQLSFSNGKDAIGSGGSFANAVMSINIDAGLAVQAAINVDPSSGGSLQIWNSAEPGVISIR